MAQEAGLTSGGAPLTLHPSCWGPSQGGPGDFLPLPWPHLFALEAVQGGSATCQQARPECVVLSLKLSGFII